MYAEHFGLRELPFGIFIVAWVPPAKSSVDWRSPSASFCVLPRATPKPVIVVALVIVITRPPVATASATSPVSR